MPSPIMDYSSAACRIPQPSFLSLPQELRDMIIDEVILLRRDPPSKLDLYSRTHHDWADKRGCTETQPVKALMLTSRRIRQEVTQALDRFRRSSVECVVDVAYLAERGSSPSLRPTWLRVPVFVPHIHTLHARVRSLDTATQASPCFRTGGGVLLVEAWDYLRVVMTHELIWILELLLWRKQAARHITVQNLVLDFPAELQLLRRFVVEELGRLLCIRTDIVHGCGCWQILYEDIGAIEIRQGGKFECRFDLGDMFRHVPFDLPSAVPFRWRISDPRIPPRLQSWLGHARQQRLRAGLPVKASGEQRLDLSLWPYCVPSATSEGCHEA